MALRHSIRKSRAFRAASSAVLLTGLLLTGLVDEPANAGSNIQATQFFYSDQGNRDDLPLLSDMAAPASVELRIEGEGTNITHMLYFPPDRIDLTLETMLALHEIIDHIAAHHQPPRVSVTSQDSDPLLSFERINTVLDELERCGHKAAGLYTWSEHDITTANRL